MKTVSLKIEQDIFEETQAVLSVLKKSRNRYINEALDYYNKIQKRKSLRDELHRESLLVRENSMRILKEFEAIDDEG